MQFALTIKKKCVETTLISHNTAVCLSFFIPTSSTQGAVQMLCHRCWCCYATSTDGFHRDEHFYKSVIISKWLYLAKKIFPIRRENSKLSWFIMQTAWWMFPMKQLTIFYTWGAHKWPIWSEMLILNHKTTTLNVFNAMSAVQPLCKPKISQKTKKIFTFRS